MGNSFLGTSCCRDFVLLVLTRMKGTPRDVGGNRPGATSRTAARCYFFQRVVSARGLTVLSFLAFRSFFFVVFLAAMLFLLSQHRQSGSIPESRLKRSTAHCAPRTSAGAFPERWCERIRPGNLGVPCQRFRYSSFSRITD